MKREQIIEEVIGVIFLSLAVLFVLSLISYSPDDLTWYTTSTNIPVRNYINIFGAYLSGALYFAFGHASYLVPLICLIFSLKWFRKMEAPLGWSRIVGIVIAFLSLSSFLAIFLVESNALRFYRGGIVGLVF